MTIYTLLTLDTEGDEPARSWRTRLIRTQARFSVTTNRGRSLHAHGGPQLRFSVTSRREGGRESYELPILAIVSWIGAVMILFCITVKVIHFQAHIACG